MHVPVEVAERNTQRARDCGADVLIAVGGGSAVGLAKAIALETSLPIIAVPTTYAGSEMSTIWGLTEAARKRTGKDLRVLPKTVIYDAAVTTSLPASISAASAMNAIAHLVEGLYAPGVSPVVHLMAEEGIRAIAASLPTVVREPGNLEARAEAQYGAWLAGWMLSLATMGVHHKVCHTLGGTYDLPHAGVHSSMIAYATAFNAQHAPAAMRRIVRALNAAGRPGTDAAAGLWDLATDIGAPTSLSSVGMKATDIDEAAEIVSAANPVNPRPVTIEGARELIAAAHAGNRPTSGNS